MFNWIKQQAKNAFSWVNNNIVKPVVKTVTPVVNTVKNTYNNVVKSVTTPSKNSTGTTYKSPTPSAPQGPTQAQINQQTVNDTANKLKGWLSSYNAKTVQNPPSWSKPVSPDYAAQSKARAAEIRKGWGNSISKMWNSAANWVGGTTAGKWIDDTFYRPGREIDQKYNDAESLNRQAELNAKMWEKRTTKIQAEIDQRLRDRDSGKISPEEYNAWATAEDAKWTKAAQKDIAYFGDAQKKIETAVSLNKSAKVISSGLNWLTNNPVSKVAGWGVDKIWKAFNLPVRAEFAVTNAVTGGIESNKRYKSALDKQRQEQDDYKKNTVDPLWNAYKANPTNETFIPYTRASQTWQDMMGRKVDEKLYKPQGSWLDRLKQGWNESKDQSFSGAMDFYGDNVLPKKLSGAEGFFRDVAFDPVSWLPSDWGTKVASKIGGAISKTSWAKTAVQAWDKSKNPIVKGIKWLGGDALSSSEKLQKTLEKTSKSKKFDSLPAEEQQLVRDLVGKNIDLRGMNVDAILDIVKSRQKMYKQFLNSERRAGMNVTDRNGYFGKVTSGNLGKTGLKGDELYDQRFWRKKGDNILTTKKAFADAEATRIYLHLKTTGQLAEGHDAAKVIKELYDQSMKQLAGLSDKEIQQVQRLMLNNKTATTLGRAFGSGAKAANLRKYIEPSFKAAGSEIAKQKLIRNLKDFRVIPWKGGPVSPTQLWKKSVLQYRPAWYINNASWNVPASFMAGGGETLRSYLKLGAHAIKERTLSPKIIERMPKEVVGSGMYSDLGKAGKRVLGEKVENFSRAAAYDAMIRKGLSPEAATKRVNKYLFDYKTTKNWERPLKTVAPFWNWTKNITRLSAQLPFTNPRAFTILKQIKTDFMDKPLNEIPDQNLSYTDPDSGQVVNYNPRDAFRGKIKIPGKGWRTVPFLPIMPSQLEEIGLNPWLRYSAEYLSGKDSFGQSFLGKDSVASRFAKGIPQLALGKSLSDMLKQKTGEKFGPDYWISESGYSKSKQGIDPSKPNYNEGMDKTKQWEKDFKNFAFAGWGNYKNFDEKKFKEGQKYVNFSKEYFSHNWDQEYSPDQFEAKQAAKEALAKKYGYDLQKDIYSGKWRQYDTPDTLAKKDSKEAMIAERTKIYDEYGKLPKGTGERTAFIKKYKDKIANDPEFLKKYPGMDLFPNTPVGNLKSKTAVQYNGKWFKTTASRDKYIAYQTNKPFWDKYWSSTSAKVRRDMLRARPDLAKKKTMVLDPNSPNLKVRMAWAYEKLDPIARKKYFKDQGIVYSGPSMSFEEKDQIAKESKAYDLSVNPELRTFQSEYAKKIKSTVRSKKVKTGKKITWGSGKTIDKVSWKA